MYVVCTHIPQIANFHSTLILLFNNLLEAPDISFPESASKAYGFYAGVLHVKIYKEWDFSMVVLRCLRLMPQQLGSNPSSRSSFQLPANVHSGKQLWILK